MVLVNLRKCEIEALIRCDNEDCGGVTFLHEIIQNSWHCPFCGRSNSKSEGHPNLSHSFLARGWRVLAGIDRRNLRKDQIK